MSLPSGYKRLEYIQSSGTQYVNTEFAGKSGLTVEVSVAFLNITGEKTLFGCIGNSQRIFLQHDSSTGFLFAYGAWHKTSFTPVANQKYKFTANFSTGNQTLLVDGTSVYSGTDTTVVSTDKNIYLCSLNFNGSSNYYFEGKLYSCQIYDNGTLRRDYIPCQKPDGTIGLWDDVNSVFYGNAGTGTFTAGPIVVPLSKITELEYIQSSGTQYVDTGFKPNNNSRVVLDFEPTASYSSIVGIFGTRDAKSGTAANMFVFWNNGTNTFRTDYFGTQKTMTVSTILARQTVDKDKNVTTIGSVSVSNTVSTGQCSNNLYLFCTNNAGTAQYFAKLKLYSCQIYDNGTLIRDYIPAKLDDGTVGLYDKLNGLLYINAGTGTFISGGNVLNLPVNIGGDWKKANKAFVNIGGTWKTAKAAFVNIGGTWEKIG